jgi:signal transduction histidine kinase
MLVWLLITGFMSVAAAAAEPRSRTVLIIDESEPSSGASRTFASTIRATLSGVTPHVAVYGETLDVSRFAGPRQDDILRRYLQDKYRDIRFGVIVAVGLSAVGLVNNWRSELWSGVPLVFAAIDEMSASRLTLDSDVTGVVMHRTINSMMSAARMLVSDLKGIAVLGGTLERDPYRRQYLEELPALANKIDVINLTGLPLAEQIKRAAELPDKTAILYTSLFIDNAGTTYSSQDALSAIAEVANRPIVVDVDSLSGHGATGGFVLNNVSYGQEVASLTLRIIDGVGVDRIPVKVSQFTRPVFDWRQMRRWGISESSLPVGSEIRFRDVTVWQQYPMQILAISAALLLQAALISWLIYEHRRRNRAEVHARNAMSELNQMNRIASAGELSASIAHEVNQPLTGISSNAYAALQWIHAEKPDLGRAVASLEQIVVASHHTSNIITSICAMFKKDTNERGPVDINNVIVTVLAVVRLDLQRKGVRLQTDLKGELPAIAGNKVQLQQVVVNLVMNAAEAMHSVQHRVLTVQSELSKPDMVHVSIKDTGTGVDPSNLDRIFKPLFTTKERGMGMGLSICLSIIEGHGGRIWASPGINGGSIFQFELPAMSITEPAGTMAA